MSPTADLSGCAAKLRRAKTQFDEWNADAAKWIEEVNPYRLRPEFNAEGSEVVLRLVEDVIQPPIEWGPVLGEIAYDLMSALDHLVCQLAVLAGTDPDCETTEFPIFEDAKAYKRNARVKALDAGDDVLLRDLQPYQAGNDAHSHPLWLLRRMNVIDKHRRLHLVSAAIHERVIMAVMERQMMPVADAVVTNGTKAGEEVIRFQTSNIDWVREPEVHFAPVVQVSFRDPGHALDGLSVRSTIPQFFGFIHENVFPKFEGRVGRLPL